MKYVFTDEDIKNEKNVIEIEEENVTIYGESLEGEGRVYVLTGVALVDGERYHDFQVEFELEEDPASESWEDIMSADWKFYDFLC